MRKLLLPFFGVLVTFAANAQFKFKSINNNNGRTTIVVINDSVKLEPQISNAIFNNNGRNYKASSISNARKGDVFSVILTFKHLTVFNNSRVTLMVNNQEVSIPIYETINQMEAK